MKAVLKHKVSLRLKDLQSVIEVGILWPDPTLMTASLWTMTCDWTLGAFKGGERHLLKQTIGNRGLCALPRQQANGLYSAMGQGAVGPLLFPGEKSFHAEQQWWPPTSRRALYISHLSQGNTLVVSALQCGQVRTNPHRTALDFVNGTVTTSHC